jgi:molybdenum cofactor cytidylyltransferase
VDLTDALGIADREVVALVGGGGKTTTMYRLAREAASRGRRAVASGTARFTRGSARLTAPLLIDADEAALIAAALDRLGRDGGWLVVATGEGSQERLLPLSAAAVANLAAAPSIDLVVLEADGSAMRAFKAPAEHEPAIPAAATLVVAVVGADILGRRLSAEAVHRAERVIALSGATAGEPVTPALVATVLAHTEGGRKAVPPGARFAVLINKVSARRLAAARRTAALLVAAGVERVVLAQAREEPPVVEVIQP